MLFLTSKKDMSNKSIFELVCDLKTNPLLFQDMSLLFNPLLKKYAMKLNYEDAYNELQLMFFETLLKIDTSKMKNTSDGALVNYIKKSVINNYYKLSNQRKRYYNYHIFPGDDIEKIMYSDPMLGSYSNINKDFLHHYLSDNEFEIIVLHFYNGYSINKIAKLKKISRQAVNQRKLSALRKLREVV